MTATSLPPAHQTLAEKKIDYRHLALVLAICGDADNLDHDTLLGLAVNVACVPGHLTDDEVDLFIATAMQKFAVNKQKRSTLQ